MFSLSIFSEILIIGVFLLFAFSPILIRYSPLLDRSNNIFVMVDKVGGKAGAAALVLIFAYALGMAGNEIIDEVFEKVYNDPGNNKAKLRRWATEERTRKTNALILQNNENFRRWTTNSNGALKQIADWDSKIYKELFAPNDGHVEKWKDQTNELLKKRVSEDRTITSHVKIAEFILRERSSAIREWLDRRKSNIRVLRGTIFSCALFLLCMFVHRVTKPPKKRYYAKHFVGVTVLLVVFSAAYFYTNNAYHNRIYDLYTEMPAVESTKN